MLYNDLNIEIMLIVSIISDDCVYETSLKDVKFLI